MTSRTHYHVLGVSPDATSSVIRDAYRRLARDHHPDRVASSSAVGGGRDMPTINEAYRVLNDPGRRAIYDRSLRSASDARTSSTAYAGAGTRPAAEPEERWDVGRSDIHRPAWFPWRSLLVFVSVAITGIVALAQFSDPGPDPAPDGILRIGDCVEFEPNGDAREIRCSGEGDLVVRTFNPLFDTACPGLTEPHRDRQGMGVACIELSD